MFEHEADEDVIEGGWLEGQRKDVTLTELDVRQASQRDALPRRPDGFGGTIDGDESRAGAAPRQRDRLRSHAAARLEDQTAARIGRIRVQQVDERVGLILEALIRSRVIPVDVPGR